MMLARATRGAAAASRQRAVATFAIRAPDAALRDLWQQQQEQEKDSGACTLRSQREATAACARRQQWGTVAMPDACPRSLSAAMQEPCSEARIITEGQHPYRVIFCNRAWQDMCGWSADEVAGKHGLSFLHGEATDKLTLKRINAAVKYGERVEVKLVNYTRSGRPFLNRLRVTPLTTSLGQYTHMLGILEELPMPAQQQQAQQAQEGVDRQQQQLQHV